MHTIRDASAQDAEAICNIYNHFIAHTCITFEMSPLQAQDIAERLASYQAESLPWVVCIIDAQVVGYAYACPWKSRRAYQASVEISVYLHPQHQGQGIGKALYHQLFSRLETGHIHCVVAGIALPNAASVALHESFGMKQVAHFEEIGFKFGRWIDVGYWQCLLPR